MKGNRFFKKRSKNGCLLIHGLTSSTQEMEGLADFLYSKDYTVLATLLKGHNTSEKDLSKTTWYDWYNSIKNDFDILSKNCDAIFIIGQSLGAALAIHLVANAKTKKIKGLVLLAPAIFYANKLAKFASIIKYFKKYSVKDYSKYYPNRKKAFFDIADEKALERRIAYKKVPLNSIASAFQLIKIVNNELDFIKIPVIVFHSTRDNTIKSESSQYIYNNLKLSSKKKKIILLNKSGHVLSVDFDKRAIFKEVLNFIRKGNK